LILLTLASLLFAEEPALGQSKAEPMPPYRRWSYPIVDTHQHRCFDETGEITCPGEGFPFFGQDAQVTGHAPSYRDNGDGTISDLVTHLMWQQTPDTEKRTFTQALEEAETFQLGGYDDWRLPTIKELYSLILFDGETGQSAASALPYLDTRFFDFTYGDETQGERYIDAQTWSSTEYVATTMDGMPTTFGVNFADGRIKGYGRTRPTGEMKQFVRYVRGNPAYGVNDFVEGPDGTILDQATGLMWMQVDSAALMGEDGLMDWKAALAWAESLDYAGYDDWRLPNAKELQSIVDYSRSPATTNSPAMDPLFQCTPIEDERGQLNFGFYWTSTTHLDGAVPGTYGVYIAFGEALGWMSLSPGASLSLMDVHGAGAQRSDPKRGNALDYPYGHGPQGDVIRIRNLVRCVRQ
jgi:hypothetical protein